jgi:dolichyl-phosphate beta-glucosyltransferase
MKLSVIIPAYNEEERLPCTLGRMVRFFRQNRISFEIVVVNDGSTDNSKVIIQEYAERFEEVILIDYPKNRGKGYAVSQGVSKGLGDLFLFSDADLSTPIEAYEKLVPFINSGYDIVIGSRRIKGADVRIRQPVHRRILGRGFGLLAQIVFLRGIKDSQCGFKLFKSSVAKNAFGKRKVDGFSFDVEVLYIARKNLHARIREIPVEWSDSAKLSKVRASRETFRMLKDLFRIRMLH